MPGSSRIQFDSVTRELRTVRLSGVPPMQKLDDLIFRLRNKLVKIKNFGKVSSKFEEKRYSSEWNVNNAAQRGRRRKTNIK